MRGNDSRENSCTIFGRPRADGRGGLLKIADLKFNPCLYKVHNLLYKKGYCIFSETALYLFSALLIPFVGFSRITARVMRTLLSITMMATY